MLARSSRINGKLYMPFFQEDIRGEKFTGFITGPYEDPDGLLNPGALLPDA